MALEVRAVSPSADTNPVPGLPSLRLAEHLGASQRSEVSASVVPMQCSNRHKSAQTARCNSGAIPPGSRRGRGGLRDRGPPLSWDIQLARLEGLEPPTF